MRPSTPVFSTNLIPRALLPLASIAMASSASAASPQEATQWTAQQLRGMFHAAPIGLLEIAPTVPLPSQRLLVSGTSLTGPLPAEWTTARFGAAGDEFPEYSLEAIRTGIELATTNYTVPDLKLGGISTGGDMCPQIQFGGQMPIGNGADWYFLSVKIGEPDQPGLPYGKTGSTLASLTAPEHSVLSYYFEGNNFVQQNLRDAVTVEELHSDLGYGVTDSRKITGIDRGIGVISHDPGGARTEWLADIRDSVYFSFTQAWVSVHGGPLANALPNNPLITAGTIYQLKWGIVAGTSTWGWSNFDVAFSDAELFGTSYPAAELDAISVDIRSNGSARRVIFSTTIATQSPDQLMGYDTQTMAAGGAMPIRTQSNERVSDKLGLRRGQQSGVGKDNVTGTCGGDPQETRILSVFGVPVETPPSTATRQLGLSVYRSRVHPLHASPDAEILHFAVSGIPTTLGVPLAAVLELGFVSQEAVDLGNLQPNQWFQLPLTKNIPSQSSELRWDIPGPLPDLGGVAWRIRVFDATGTVGLTCTSLMFL